MIALAVRDFERFGRPVSFFGLSLQKVSIVSKVNKRIMASKDQIRKHLSISSSVNLSVSKPSNGEETKKMRVMEHVQISKGSKA